MAAAATDPKERLLELRDLATGEVRRFAVVRDESSGGDDSDVVRAGHAPPTARNEAEAREARDAAEVGDAAACREIRASCIGRLGGRV